MKPYHLIDRWVDLDSILSISDLRPGYTGGQRVEFSVTLAFQDKPFRFSSCVWDDSVIDKIPKTPHDTYIDRVGKVLDERIKEAHAMLLVAWKTKETMFGGSK